MLAPPPLTPSALTTNIDLKDLLSKKVLKHSCRVGQQKGYRCLPLAKPDRPVSSQAYLPTAGLNHQPQGNLPVSAPKSSGAQELSGTFLWPGHFLGIVRLRPFPADSTWPHPLGLLLQFHSWMVRRRIMGTQGHRQTPACWCWHHSP